MALQFNYLTDKGRVRAAVRPWEVDLSRIRGGGARSGARSADDRSDRRLCGSEKMLDTLGVMRPEVEKTLKGVGTVPVDIRPRFATAERLTR